ncbi:MAG: GNAT family N-acetyltransferase [Pseudomonadota bacterium]
MLDYKKTISLGDSEIDIHAMSRDDRDAMLAFAQKLPDDDLLFLRVDITQPEVVDQWLDQIEEGHSVSLVAYDSAGLIGYATVHRTEARWTRNLGELRVNVSADYRGKGLGRHLTSEIFDVARSLGLRKLMASMISDQKGAQAAFRRLGFVTEAMFSDHVDDMNGTPRDLVVMTHDITGHSDVLEQAAKL